VVEAYADEVRLPVCNNDDNNLNVKLDTKSRLDSIRTKYDTFTKDDPDVIETNRLSEVNSLRGNEVEASTRSMDATAWTYHIIS
jgi:type II secretory pathway component HofQ